jgi:hypothetical protein
MARKYLVVRMSWDGQCETAEDLEKWQEEVDKGTTHHSLGADVPNIPRPKRHLNELVAEGWEVDRVLTWTPTQSSQRYDSVVANGYLLLSMDEKEESQGVFFGPEATSYSDLPINQRPGSPFR